MSNNLTPVLLVAFHFPPDPSSGSARPFRFYKFLPEFGYQPHVFTVGEQPASALPNVTYVPSEAFAATRKTLVGCMELALRKTFFRDDHGVLWAQAAKQAVARALRETPFKAVISTFPPINTHLVGSWVHKRYGLPWIADYRDPLVGNPFRQTLGLSAWADRTLERRFVRSATASLAITDVVFDEWKTRLPQHASNFHLLWNGFDPDDKVVPDPIAGRANRVLAHVGTLYGHRTPEPVLSSLRRLLERGRIDTSALRIRLIGIIDPKIEQANTALFEWLRERGMLYISQGVVPREEAQHEARNADYLLLVDITDRGGYAVPAKIFEYIRAGRPILAYTDEDSPVDRILSKAGIPYKAIYRGESEDRIDEKLLAFLSFSSDVTLPSEWFLDQFDGRRQTAVLARLLDKCVKT